jgi:uncharacterized membrane protein (DUF4010 family)
MRTLIRILAMTGLLGALSALVAIPASAQVPPPDTTSSGTTPVLVTHVVTASDGPSAWSIALALLLTFALGILVAQAVRAVRGVRRQPVTA